MKLKTSKIEFEKSLRNVNVALSSNAKNTFAKYPFYNQYQFLCSGTLLVIANSSTVEKKNFLQIPFLFKLISFSLANLLFRFLKVKNVTILMLNAWHFWKIANIFLCLIILFLHCYYNLKKKKPELCKEQKKFPFILTDYPKMASTLSVVMLIFLL